MHTPQPHNNVRSSVGKNNTSSDGMFQVSSSIFHVTDAGSNIILAEQEWTSWTTNQTRKRKIRSGIGVCFLCLWRGLPAVSQYWKWFWNWLVPPATWPKLKHYTGLKKSFKSGHKVGAAPDQTPEKMTTESDLGSEFTTINAWTQPAEPLRVDYSVMCLWKLPSEFQGTHDFWFLCLSTGALALELKERGEG